MTVREEHIRVQVGFVGRPLYRYVWWLWTRIYPILVKILAPRGWLEHDGPEYGGRKRTTDQVDGRLAGVDCAVVCPVVPSLFGATPD